MKPLDPDFPLRSDLSVRLPHIPLTELRVELDQELAKRVTVYAGHVRGGTMSEADADHHIALWQALIDDHDRMAGRACPPYAFDWPARIAELRRELDKRRKAYPKWIASPTNPLTHAEAVWKLERLDALHWAYWFRLIAFTPPGERARTDPPRIVWIATAERARIARRREALEHGYAAHVAAHEQLTRRADIWRVIELHARMQAGETTEFGEGPDDRDLRICAEEADRRFAEACDRHQPGDPDWRDQLAIVARWLEHHLPAETPAIIEERMAA